MEVKVRNWCIKFDESKGNNSSAIAGLLMYEGKIIPSWGCGMRFIIDVHSVRYDYPEVIPAYVKNKLEALRERTFLVDED